MVGRTTRKSFTARAHGYFSASRLITSDTDQKSDIYLTPAVRVIATVLDSDGTPLIQSRIRVFYFQEELMETDQEVGPFETDGTGKLELPVVKSGEQFFLEIRKPGQLPVFTGPFIFVSDTIASVQIRVEKSWTPARTLTGRVTDNRGKPIAGALVEIERPLALDSVPAEIRSNSRLKFSADEPNLTTTDSEGEFIFSGLPPAPVQISARKEGFKLSERSTRPGPNSITTETITLTPAP